MLIDVTENYLSLSRTAVRMVRAMIQKNPTPRIGVATGETPTGLYEELIHLYRQGDVDFSNVEIFGLDEYLGVPPDHPDSFHAYLHRHLLDHIAIKSERVHLFDGSPRSDYMTYCRQYEETIRERGGIDLQILGIGRNGHIGFNEPSSSFDSRTRVVVLADETLDDNKKACRSHGAMTGYALTLGIRTILEARTILLLVSGSGKAKIVARALEGPLTASVPASSLQLHSDVHVLLDEAAAAELRHKEYYRRVVQMTSL